MISLSLSLSLSSRHRRTPRSYAHAVAPVRRITRTAAQDRVAPPFRDHIFERGPFNFLHLTTATHECCHDRGRTSPEGRPRSARRPVHACPSGRTNLHAKRPSTRGQRSRAPTISATSIHCQSPAPVRRPVPAGHCHPTKGPRVSRAAALTNHFLVVLCLEALHGLHHLSVKHQLPPRLPMEGRSHCSARPLSKGSRSSRTAAADSSL